MNTINLSVLWEDAGSPVRLQHGWDTWGLVWGETPGHDGDRLCRAVWIIGGSLSCAWWKLRRDFSQLSILFPSSSRSCTWGRSCMPQGYSVSSPALSLAFILLFLSPWWRPVWKHWEVGGCWLLLWLHLLGILIYHISSHTIIKCVMSLADSSWPEICGRLLPHPATSSWIGAAMGLFYRRKIWLLLEFSLFRFLYIFSTLMVLIFICLAALGLSCDMQDLWMWHADS